MSSSPPAAFSYALGLLLCVCLLIFLSAPEWTLRLLNSLFHNFPLSSAQKLPVLFLTSVCMVSLAASLPHIYLKMKFHQIENWDFHRSCIKCVQQFGKNLHSYSIVFPTEALLISPFRRVFFISSSMSTTLWDASIAFHIFYICVCVYAHRCAWILLGSLSFFWWQEYGRSIFSSGLLGVKLSCWFTYFDLAPSHLLPPWNNSTSFHFILLAFPDSLIPSVNHTFFKSFSFFMPLAPLFVLLRWRPPLQVCGRLWRPVSCVSTRSTLSEGACALHRSIFSVLGAESGAKFLGA